MTTKLMAKVVARNASKNRTRTIDTKQMRLAGADNPLNGGRKGAAEDGSALIHHLEGPDYTVGLS